MNIDAAMRALDGHPSASWRTLAVRLQESTWTNTPQDWRQLRALKRLGFPVEVAVPGCLFEHRVP